MAMVMPAWPWMYEPGDGRYLPGNGLCAWQWGGVQARGSHVCHMAMAGKPGDGCWWCWWRRGGVVVLVVLVALVAKAM